MNVKLYKTTDPINVLSKTLTDETTKTGTLKENCDVLTPSILFGFNPIAYNYAYIEDFGRYYYVGKPINEGAALWRVDLTVDPLMSWKDGIKASPCIAAKSSSAYNLYLNDPNYKSYQDPHVFSEVFPSGFNVSNASFIMTLFGDKVAAT